jgi:hypothetical protein
MISDSIDGWETQRKQLKLAHFFKKLDLFRSMNFYSLRLGVRSR